MQKVREGARVLQFDGAHGQLRRSVHVDSEKRNQKCVELFEAPRAFFGDFEQGRPLQRLAFFLENNKTQKKVGGFPQNGAWHE
jgi:hypothetical protein